MNLVEMIIPINPFSRPGTKRSYTRNIVWHYTGNPGATARGHYGYFGNVLPNQDPYDSKKDTYASAHIFIDRNDTVLTVPLDEIAYHANQANAYSVGVELCIELDGSFHPETIKRAIECGKWLNKKYNVKTSDYLRHYDVTGKICPKAWVDNPAAWEDFRKKVDGKEVVRVPNWTDYQWEAFTKVLDSLYTASTSGKIDPWVFSDYSWVEKASKRTLTVDEIIWLQGIMFARHVGVKF